jgi:hypothetical protein
MKHKKLLAILLSLAIMVTFMPMMAFAAVAAAPSWTDGYKTVTYDGNTFQTEHAFDSASAMVTVTALPIQPSSIGASDGVAVPAEVTNKYYYDLTGATLVYQSGSEWKALDGTKWASKDVLDAATIGIAVVEQSYMKDYDKHVKANDGKPVVVVKNFGSIGSLWKASKVEEGYDATKAEKDQSVKVSAKLECTASGGESQVTGDAGKEDLWGSVAPATVTVVGKAMTVADAGFYFDSEGNGTAVKDGGKLEGFYDGSAHTVVADTVPGWTVSYAVFGTNGKYNAVNSVSITDVLKDGSEIKVRATFKDNKNKAADVNKFFTVNLKAPAWTSTTTTAAVTFNKELSEKDDTNVYRVGGSEYNTADYVAVYPVTKEIPANSPTAKADRAQNAAIEKAVAANADQIKAWFNDYYFVKEKTYKSSPNYIVLKFASKDLTDLTDAEKKALEEKYAQLILNIGTPSVSGSADLFINQDAIVDVEVEFTKAPTTVTYKGSKTTKKGKLKKNQTITVEAVANNGAPVYYKLQDANTSKIKIDKKTGKITVKKGLTKGTYKFKVKAYVPYSEAYNYYDAYEIQNITVKVKK